MPVLEMEHSLCALKLTKCYTWKVNTPPEGNLLRNPAISLSLPYNPNPIICYSMKLPKPMSDEPKKPPRITRKDSSVSAVVFAAKLQQGMELRKRAPEAFISLQLEKVNVLYIKIQYLHTAWHNTIHNASMHHFRKAHMIASKPYSTNCTPLLVGCIFKRCRVQ